jgi:hypothetical protein
VAKEKESPKPSGKLTMWQANILVALLAGFWKTSRITLKWRIGTADYTDEDGILEM